MMGDNYTHFKLPEPVLNPVMAKAAATLLDLPESHLEDIINSKRFVDAAGKVVTQVGQDTESGSMAIQKLLKRIDVEKATKEATEKAENVKNPTELNKLHRKIRYLKQLKMNDMKPEDYIINNVLVVPPKFRPMFTMGTEGTVIMSDVNDLYQQAAMTAETMKDLKTTVRDVAGTNKPLENTLMAQVRGAMYQDVKALVGLREPTSFLHKIKDKKGFIMQIDGGKKQTKEGFYQDKVISRRQDLVGRSTIILNPDLGGDQIGIPKEMANKIFQPFIVKEIVGLGYTPLEAQKHIKEETEVFKRARQLVADKRLVIANRAPTLHRWNMTAFRPSLTDGKAIEVPSTVIAGLYNADIDGDSLSSSVFISINISKLQEYLKINKIPKKDLVFGGDIGYISLEEFIQERKIVMPANAKLPVRAGEDVVHINMQDFPRIESTKRVTEKGTICYDVPEGVSIYTTDKTGKNLDLYPVTEFSIHPDLDNLIVEFKNGDEMLVSDDHSLVAMDMDLGELKEIKPESAIGKAIPKATRIDIVPSITEIKLKNYSTTSKAVATKESVPADERLGYVIGLVVGGGWVDAAARGICLANIDDNVGNEFCDIINSMLMQDTCAVIQDNHHDFDGYDCYSKKFTKSTVALAQNFIPWVGQGARNKHLPPFFMSTSEEFRLGLLAGLIDTDGTISWAHAKVKKNKQLMCAYSTMSERLADEVVTLCRTLGIKATITTTTKGEYHIGISSVGLYETRLNLRHAQKKDTLNEFQSTPYTESQIKYGIAAHDLVPFSERFFDIAKKEFKCRKENAMYCAIHNGKQIGLISRYSAKKILSRMPDAFPKWWIDVVNNEDVTWTTVRECRRNHNRITMYDITVPGPYTFMTSCGIVVQDTFQIHTPVGQKALDEAEHMLASSDLLKTGYGTTLATTGQDSTVGSWLMSKGKGGEQKGRFDSLEKAREAHRNNKLEYSDTVEIGGIKAPYGVHEANSVVPDDMKKYNVEFKGTMISKWIEEITKKHGGKIGLALADKLKEIGNEYSTVYGFTIGISDTNTAREIRDPLIKPILGKKSYSDEFMINEVNNKVGDEIKKQLAKKYDENTMIGVALHSEGGKGIGNTSQIISAPLVMQDANKKIIPMPVTRSYSEGLKSGEYWAAAHGARSGNIQKSVASYKPGWLTSDLINSIYTTRIYGENPMDSEGMEENISDTKNIMNRYTAQEVKDSKGRVIAKRNEIINSDLINRLNMAGIKTVMVQSPLTDPSPADGISSWSYGVDYKGNRYKAGDNIGIISAHTLTEPSLNMAMKAFHTGGAFSKSGTAFDVLDRLMRFGKNIPDKATVAEETGVVTSVKPSSIGGYDITIKDADGEEREQYVVTGNELKVKKGDKVTKGDVMSGGTVSIHDVMKTKGIKDAQKFLVKEISAINEHKLDKRDIEVLVRGVTNTTRIKKGSGSPYVPGDVAPLTTINYYNNNRVKEVDVEDAEGSLINKDYGAFRKGSLVTGTLIRHLQDKGIKRIEVEAPSIVHEPFLSSQGIGSKSSTGEDFIARLSTNRLAGMLQ
jgi:DNA-directed RNA polymerase beta' subunit